MDNAAAIVEAASKYAKGNAPNIGYGTAGFRCRADILDHVLLRTGVLAALRSKYKHGSMYEVAAIGLMVTASHNPEEDNGAKLVDPMGEMLENSWEQFATKLANCSDDDLPGEVHAVVTECNIDMTTKGKVVIGRDTRDSGLRLAQAAITGCIYYSAVGAEVVDLGIVTTPQVHYVVRCTNDPSYGTASIEGYFDKLANAFHTIWALSAEKEPLSLKVDCANGVGALQLKQLLPRLSDMIKCGADYVKVQQREPENFVAQPNDRCVTFDGDADRVLYFFNRSGSFFMLDGDRIASLAAQCIKTYAERAGIDLNIGVVQTAYANGNSTAFLEKIVGVPVVFTSTGVKHLHHKALEYDVGIYFEANGHGTVLFNQKALALIKERSTEESIQARSAAILEALANLINQTVGDAISDMLMVEAILLLQKMSTEDWASSYNDLPNRQLKVKIADRNAIRTANAGRCESTLALSVHDAINEIVAKYPCARSFVRPSGTEDVVRVYAESDTQEHADVLALEVAGKVHDLAGGVGPHPSST
eukprot:gene9379-1627_t